MDTRRPLTAAAASSLLIALMFMPSASATGEQPGAAPVQEAPAQKAPAQDVPVQDAPAQGGAAEQDTETPTVPGEDAGAAALGTTVDGENLADTGSMNTKPYLWGGTAFIGVGALLVVLARRRQLMLDDLPEPDAA